MSEVGKRIAPAADLILIFLREVHQPHSHVTAHVHLVTSHSGTSGLEILGRYIKIADKW
jgi:hypothetical protein